MWQRFKEWFIKDWTECWKETKESAEWTVDWVYGDK